MTAMTLTSTAYRYSNFSEKNRVKFSIVVVYLMYLKQKFFYGLKFFTYIFFSVILKDKVFLGKSIRYEIRNK